EPLPNFLRPRPLKCLKKGRVCIICIILRTALYVSKKALAELTEQPPNAHPLDPNSFFKPNPMISCIVVIWLRHIAPVQKISIVETSQPVQAGERKTNYNSPRLAPVVSAILTPRPTGDWKLITFSQLNFGYLQASTRHILCQAEKTTDCGDRKLTEFSAAFTASRTFVPLSLCLRFNKA
uniref:Uncharacterized protein n=1 Tax=Romanomermis culicivorax TaxID=13658 RepID=A0A915JCF6_ROMCU